MIRFQFGQTYTKDTIKKGVVHMAVTLYKRQRQIVDFISQYIQRNGFSPTLQEIADAIGVSSLATVHEHLQALIRKKVLKKYDGAVRGLELVDRTFLRLS